MSGQIIQDFRDQQRLLEESLFPKLSAVQSLDSEIADLRRWAEQYSDFPDYASQSSTNSSSISGQLKTRIISGEGVLSFFVRSKDFREAGFFDDIVETISIANELGVLPTDRVTFTNLEILRRLIAVPADRAALLSVLDTEQLNPTLMRKALEYRIEIDTDLEGAIDKAIEELHVTGTTESEQTYSSYGDRLRKVLAKALERHRELGIQIADIRAQIRDLKAVFRAQVTEALQSRPTLQALNCEYIEKILLELRGIDEDHFIELAIQEEVFLNQSEYLVGAASTKVCAICYGFRNTNNFGGYLNHVSPAHFGITVDAFLARQETGVETSWKFFMLKPDQRTALIENLINEGLFELELFDFYFQIRPLDPDMPATKADVFALKNSVLPGMGVEYDDFMEALHGFSDELPTHGASLRSYVQFVSRQTREPLINAIADVFKRS